MIKYIDYFSILPGGMLITSRMINGDPHSDPQARAVRGFIFSSRFFRAKKLARKN